jgi:hypothetical protein
MQEVPALSTIDIVGVVEIEPAATSAYQPRVVGEGNTPSAHEQRSARGGTRHRSGQGRRGTGCRLFE